MFTMRRSLRLTMARAFAGLRPPRVLILAAANVARSAGGRAMAVLFAVGCGATSQSQLKLALCSQPPPPPKLSERKVSKADRINIVLVGKTGHGKSSIANILCGLKDTFVVSDDLSSVTADIQFVDFDYKGQQVRIIDTPGFFDTSMPPEQVQASLDQFGDVAREGITALLVVVKKERFTAENAAVCEFVHCVLGDGALGKYGTMIMTHTNDTPESLRKALAALPAENYGSRMLELVKGRLLAVETRNWRQSKIREKVLQQVIEMREQNDFTACDPLMLQWARIKHLEEAKLETEMRPHLAALEQTHVEQRERMQREMEEREEQFQQQLVELQARLEAAPDGMRGDGMRVEIEQREKAHQEQARQLEAKLAQIEQLNASKLAKIEQEYITRGGGVVVGEVEEPDSKAGDLDFIKHAARQQQVRELDGKMRYEWNRRTQEFGNRVTACSIQ